MGLLCCQLNKYGIAEHRLRPIFRLFALAFFPAFLLSVLWLKVPSWVYALVAIAAALQLTGWALLLKRIKENRLLLTKSHGMLTQSMFVLWATALTIKLCLQAGSVIPSLSKLAFGFRPVVIGYLHLVLLGVITLFILTYIITLQYIAVNKLTVKGIIVFITGIIINETLLMGQGVAAMNYKNVPFINPLLFAAAVVLLLGALLINVGQKTAKVPIR